MKIIEKDNYDREIISEQTIAENVSEFYAKLICKKLNEGEGDKFYFAVNDNYVLYIFEP